MNGYRILIITDHRKHTAENGVYPIGRALHHHPGFTQVDIVTRSHAAHADFFEKHLPGPLQATPVKHDFSFYPDGRDLSQNLRPVALTDYDVVWLRLPPPFPEKLAAMLTTCYPQQLFINHPAGILRTGSKDFLLDFPALCPPMQLCQTLEDIIQFKARFAIVLKPLRAYGGQGVVRIDGDQVSSEGKNLSFAQFARQYQADPQPYLGVKFLKNVSMGDKRIVVFDGHIMGAALRIPAPGSWLCNVAQGGNSIIAEVDADEEAIIAALQPTLAQMGVVMYGIDTLVGDDNKRVLSEINATSIGGLQQMAQQNGQPLVEQAVEILWQYIDRKLKNITC
ncbi:MAG: glutathione synthetase [Bacteroidetes bacterium]|nr:MAG: glutathione synthetase [Bacteroidota bacterium]PTM12435.1 MAG: glutathione synthetase [Bacteroidota bacterium]